MGIIGKLIGTEHRFSKPMRKYDLQISIFALYSTLGAICMYSRPKKQCFCFDWKNFRFWREKINKTCKNRDMNVSQQFEHMFCRHYSVGKLAIWAGMGCISHRVKERKAEKNKQIGEKKQI